MDHTFQLFSGMLNWVSASSDKDDEKDPEGSSSGRGGILHVHTNDSALTLLKQVVETQHYSSAKAYTASCTGIDMQRPISIKHVPWTGSPPKSC